jgi:hypothetical protein
MTITSEPDLQAHFDQTISREPDAGRASAGIEAGT